MNSAKHLHVVILSMFVLVTSVLGWSQNPQDCSKVPSYEKLKTAMTNALTQEARDVLETRIALKRLGTVDDVAYAAVFLASEQAGYITGTVLNVSGGLYT